MFIQLSDYDDETTTTRAYELLSLILIKTFELIRTAYPESEFASSSYDSIMISIDRKLLPMKAHILLYGSGKYIYNSNVGF